MTNAAADCVGLEAAAELEEEVTMVVRGGGWVRHRATVVPRDFLLDAPTQEQMIQHMNSTAKPLLPLPKYMPAFIMRRSIIILKLHFPVCPVVCPVICPVCGRSPEAIQPELNCYVSLESYS